MEKMVTGKRPIGRPRGRKDWRSIYKKFACLVCPVGQANFLTVEQLRQHYHKQHPRIYGK